MSFHRTDPRPARNERGIVLAAALLFLLLTSVLVLTFMTTTTGERSQSSNVQTAKLALYAADAGVRAQQQILANMAQVKLDSCLNAYIAGGSIGNIVKNPQNLFPAGTLNAANSANSTSPPYGATANITFSNAGIADTAQVFNYLFNVTSTGNVRSTGKRSVQSQGLLRVSATRGSFANYLLFMDTFTLPDASTIWFTSSGSFDGRLHTNTGFKFAFKPTFQDQVTQVAANATFYNNGSPVTKNANNNGTIDVPNFFGGYLRSFASIPLPTNAYNQQAASLGLNNWPANTVPTSAQINTQLGIGSGTPPAGVYLPHAGAALTGGIYVQGNADKVKMWADTLVNKQFYQITYGGSTVRTIEVDRVLNTTKLWNNSTMSGGAAASYVGVPPNGVLYGTGSINSLTGPDRNSVTGFVNAAIAENTKLLVAAVNDIVIQGDLTCDSFNNQNNVLGIYSATGAVHIGTAAPKNLNVDAFIMAAGTTGGQFTVDSYSSTSLGARGSMNLRGGAVAKFYGAFGTFDASGKIVTGYSRNWHYDRRGLIPPYYPTTTRFDADIPSARTMSWKEI